MKLKRKIRILRFWINRNFALVSVIAILLFTSIAMGFFFSKWFKAVPTQERPFGTFLYMVFGLASVGSFAIAIWILKTIKKKRFSESRELLERFIKIFKDAAVSRGPIQISILHFVPCPGLFDSKFTRDKTFKDLRYFIDIVKREQNVTIRAALLAEDERKEFLQKFFDYEKGGVSEKAIIGGGGTSGYETDAEDFISRAFEQDIKTYHIGEQWLQKALDGQQFTILGAGAKVGFIGLASFVGGHFKFDAADYEGNTEVIHTLFDQLVKIYV